jgi:NDP-sugar pyrophosphorylase family protein
VIIGEGCEIGPNACIFPSTTIGNNSVIHPFSEIRNSVIMDGVHIGSNSFITHSIIAKGTVIRNHFASMLGENTLEIEGEFKKVKNIGVMIGEDCLIESHVAVEPAIIIGRRSKIAPVKRINKNIPSESKVM